MQDSARSSKNLNSLTAATNSSAEYFFKHSYDTSKTYEVNFEEAYRRFVNPQAKEDEINRAGNEMSLYVPMGSLPWFKGFVPIQAIKEDYRSTFTPMATQTCLLENSQGLQTGEPVVPAPAP